MKRTLLILVLALALLAAGCSEGATDGAPTATVNGTPATTASTTDATGTPSATPNPQADSGIEIVNTTDADGDGRYEAFGVRVRANTSIPEGDDGGDDTTGEPYFAVRAGGQWRFDTAVVERATDFETTIPLNASVLPDEPNEDLNVTIRLLDRDLAMHDRIASWSATVAYAPAATPTPTATDTPTATPTATPTPTPTPAESPTPAAAPTPTVTVSTTPTPARTATPTATSTPTTTPTPTPTPTNTPAPSVSVPPEVPDGEARQATVTRVVDGDTMEVTFADGTEDTVRLIGVDTPETTLGDVSPAEYEGIPETQAARDHLYNWGQEASQYAVGELEGQEVRVVLDPEGDRRGSFGRLLAYLYVDEENFNRALLEQGLARVYDSTFSLREDFDSVEAQARSGDVGLWGFEGDVSTPTPAPGGGSGSGQLTIESIQPEGDDETVTLRNEAGSAIDLSGYVVDFDDGQDYTIQGVALGAGETLVVHTGEGTDSSGDVYAGFGSPVLNNDGDTVTIRDDSGAVVAQRSYGDGG